jgi:antitoxin HigA-1
MSQAAFARSIGVSPMWISHIIKGTRPVTAELAFLIGNAFGQSPQYWMKLQTDYDLKFAKNVVSKKLARIHELRI